MADRTGTEEARKDPFTSVYAATPRKYGGQCCAEIQANVSLRRAAAPSSLNLLNDTLLSEHTSFEKHRARHAIMPLQATEARQRPHRCHNYFIELSRHSKDLDDLSSLRRYAINLGV